jgi:DMSO/TMAO reductase YedYZ molybdopterin-dependent catalytic subunit
MRVDVTTGTLPPGQIETRRFPVVGERVPSSTALDLGVWRLEVGGLVDEPLSLGHADVMALATDELVADIHCVTSWTRLGTTFTGLPLRRLADRAGVEPTAGFIRFEAHSPRRHDTSIPIDLLDDTWLVHSADGEALSVEHGWPLRVVVPSRYFYKSLKWVHRIEFLAEDRPGYWERESAYHNVGDPTDGDQRFTTGSLDPRQLSRFLAATSYAKYRRRPLIGIDLRGWRPASTDLSDLSLKDCDLRGVDLSGHDLRRANLSLSDLRGADLRGANLSGADLEGADLADTDLRQADLSGAFLTATRFDRAVTTGIVLDGATGLLESQEGWLRP